MNKHREIMLRTFVARGMGQSEAEALYAKTYGQTSKGNRDVVSGEVRQPVRNAPAQSSVAAVSAKATARTEAPDETQTHTVKFSLLERIQSVTGTLRAYDGRYCVWGGNGPFDVRDIARRLHIQANAVVDALPDFKPAKRGRASDEDAE